ncbi:NAD-dependent epimerase/dehydratase family protein [Curtobacterium pusillum]|uniref:NAD-dependent epimerase/dehydratase family protein n=1 Tax=Curtobacterium pusillum TaxID=69373 RepID=UPI0011A8BD21|nr:NAD-dependent epimerase/dehydratase family protein [Curtobacterium pusillum]
MIDTHTDADSSAAPVLVTGGSGFIAGHCILQLLAAGRRVRTTVRSQARGADVRAVLASAGAERLDLLEFVTADLTSDDGWDRAVTGVSGVLHVASPVLPGQVDDEDEVVVPAREGALRVLRAARAAGVPRVVLTSAFHAVGFGHGPIDHVFTEDDWSPLDGPGMDAYGRSKVLAERAAWDFVGTGDGTPELVTIQPVAVLGPVMGDAVSGTNRLLQRMLTGGMPGFPDLAIPFVDVRDVAAAHIAALGAPGAAGQRILLSSQDTAVPLREVGALLRSTFGDRASRVPTRNIPSIVIRAGAVLRPEFREIAPELGLVKRLSTRRERELLGLTPRSWQEAVTSGARSMLERGLVG